MNLLLTQAIEALDADIAKAQAARDVLAGLLPNKAKRKRFLSKEARKRIGDAQRKRWAKRNKEKRNG